jgi:hypothetical protein
MMKAVEPRQKTPFVVPPVADMTLVVRCISPPPDALEIRLGDPPACFCFAVKIHDWPPDKAGLTDQCNLKRMGLFGYYTNANEASLASGRVIQLGWSAGCDSTTDICPRKTATVAPAGWTISGEASTYGVSQAMAERDGRPIADALQEFMADLDHAVSQFGARVVAHHLEYHATFVQKELDRSGLTSARDVWVRTAKQGYCMMDPELSEWLRHCDGQGHGSATKKSLSLSAIAEILWPAREDKRPNTARPVIHKETPTGATADAVRQIYQAVLTRTFGARAAKLRADDVSALAPMPLTVHGKLGNPDVIVAVDLETHGWPAGPSRTSIGEFGWHFIAEEGLLDFARIVQVLEHGKQGSGHPWLSGQTKASMG